MQSMLARRHNEHGRYESHLTIQHTYQRHFEDCRTHVGAPEQPTRDLFRRQRSHALLTRVGRGVWLVMSATWGCKMEGWLAWDDGSGAGLFRSVCAKVRFRRMIVFDMHVHRAN